VAARDGFAAARVPCVLEAALSAEQVGPASHALLTLPEGSNRSSVRHNAQHIRLPRRILEAHDLVVVKFGLILIDVYARKGYTDEWVGVVQKCISLMKFKMQNLGEDLIKVMLTLSQYPQYMTLIKDKGLEKYYKDLLMYKPLAEFAQFFVKNAMAV
jgi:hypothetical protein